MFKFGKNETLIAQKKFINNHYFLTPKKKKFHGFNFLITNIKNFGQKKNKYSINKLLNSSKYMLRDNKKYKSCFDLSRNIHNYPYNPGFTNISYLDKKYNLSTSVETRKTKFHKIILKNNKKEEIKNKDSPTINLLPQKILTSPISLMSPISKKKENNNFMTPNNKLSSDNIKLLNSFNKIYTNKYNDNKNNISNNNEYDIIYLNECLKNIFIEKNYFENNKNNEHLIKISNYKFDSLSIKVKLSGLNLKFYELTKKKNKSLTNISNFNYNSKKNSGVKFPFEFLYFFFGLNFDYFLIFLTKIIEFNFDKNIFELNYDKFLENYNLLKKTTFFYDIHSFIEKYENTNIKEYFRYNWDINTTNNNNNNNENIIKNFLVKIQLPKMSISIENNFKKNSVFYANIEINQLLLFLKNNFLNWDQYILSYFSEFKLFRFVKNNLLSADKNDYNKNIFNDKCKVNDNDINNIKDLKKRKYNLNKTYIILNNIKTNNKSYEFFYTNNDENYFLQLILPKIIVNYKDCNSYLNKQFDLDSKTFIKLNKLRKSFNSKDIIKYCLIFIKGKNFNRISKHSSAKNIFNKNSNKNLSKFSLKSTQTDNIKQISKKFNNNQNQNDDIIDIKLNLNENIFNFDEDILKYIKVDKVKNNLNPMAFINDKNGFEDNQDNKLNIEIEKIQLYWIKNNGDNNSKSNNIDEKKVYKFKDDESEYLFDHSSITWRKYIEKNFDKIISSSNYENQIILPSMKNSNSTVKTGKHLK